MPEKDSSLEPDCSAGTAYLRTGPGGYPNTWVGLSTWLQIGVEQFAMLLRQLNSRSRSEIARIDDATDVTGLTGIRMLLSQSNIQLDAGLPFLSTLSKIVTVGLHTFKRKIHFGIEVGCGVLFAPAELLNDDSQRTPLLQPESKKEGRTKFCSKRCPAIGIYRNS